MIWLIKEVDDSILRIQVFELNRRALWSYYNEKEAFEFPGETLYVEVLFNDDTRREKCIDIGDWVYMGEVE